MYNVTYKHELEITPPSGGLSFKHNHNLSDGTGEYFINQVLRVVANSTVEVMLPGVTKLSTILATSDSGSFDISLTEDVSSNSIYSGIFGQVYSRVFTPELDYDQLVIRAGAEDVTVKLSVIGVGA
jgi:hypothetical protein